MLIVGKEEPNYRKDRTKPNSTRGSRILSFRISKDVRSRQSLSILDALTTGFALARASRPADLKSKEQLCFSAYRWTPQKVFPHRHLKPVRPIRFRHEKHRLGLGFSAGGHREEEDEHAASSWTDKDEAPATAVEICARLFWTQASGLERGTSSSIEEPAANDCSTAAVAEEACASFIMRSLKHLEHRFLVEELPKKPQLLRQRVCPSGDCWHPMPSAPEFRFSWSIL